MQSKMCQSWTGHQGVNTWNMEYGIWNMKENKNNYLFNYLIETNGNMKENNYLFNYLIETNGNMKENNYLINYYLII